MSQTERWHLGDNAPEIYQRYLAPAIFAPWAPLLIEQAKLQDGVRVLDVACGTGVVTRLAAQQVAPSGQATGVDINKGMIDVARSCRPAAGVSLTWREADACDLPFANDTFDAVLCQIGLMYFPARVKALGEMRRVLAPHGRLVLLVWRSIAHSPGFAAIAEALDQHVSAEASAVMRAPFVFGDDITELRDLFARAQFNHVRIQSDVRMVRFETPEALVQYQVAGSPLAGHLAQVNDETRTALIRDVLAAMQSYVNDVGVAFPIEGHIAVACP